MPPRPDPSRDLLFGLLALQVGLIDQASLVAAFQAWSLDKTRGLAAHLIARGDLSDAQRAVVEAMADLHVAKHGDVERSLAAIPSGRSTERSLAQIGDPDIEGTLAHVRLASARKNGDADGDRTATYAVGTVTSNGQRFRVLRPHASGGLGAVFVALDTELHREVALKQILDSYADDPISRQRFVMEAEIAGGLEHPGIVPVYGLGTYGNGRPFYAMRFIKGDSLKEAVERFHDDPNLKKDPGRRSLELRNLLRRFTDVCYAIDYAHSRGVLHRDIKPGNIIIGKHGETLVVDWGLAKALGRAEYGSAAGERTLLPSSASGSSETLPGSALGTPAYMSPEQAAGDLDRLGPRSDVYSLGGTLYCLLTGKPPQEGNDVGELLRRVQRSDFARPRQVDPSIDPALEAICLKAMAGAPEGRYATPRLLAEDIDRWTADEPVSAYREPFLRRSRRWAMRHRTAVASAAVALVAGVVGLAGVLVVQTRATADIARALDRETRANAALADANAKVQTRYELALDAIQTFHTGVSEDFLLREEQFKELRDRLLKSAADFYGKLGALLGKQSDPASRRSLLQANYELAELTGKVGHAENALAAHQAVLAARQALAAEPGGDAGAKTDVARSLNATAALLEATGKVAEAESAYRQSESLLDEYAGTDASARAALAASRSQLGYLLLNARRYTEALPILRRARTDQEAMAAAAGASADARRDLAVTINRIGIALLNVGEPEQAEAAYRRALEIRRKLAENYPANAEYRRDLAQTHMNLGWLLGLQMQRWAEAEVEIRPAVALFRKLAEDYPGVTDLRRRLADAHSNLSVLLSETGRPDEAEAEARAMLAIKQKLADDHPARVDLRQDLAMSHSIAAGRLRVMGKVAEAEAECRAALSVAQKLADDHPAVTNFRARLLGLHFNLAFVLSGEGRLAEAEAQYRAAIASTQQLLNDHPADPVFLGDLASCHHNLGSLLLQEGRPAEALGQIRAALALYVRLADEQPAVKAWRTRVAGAHEALGVVFLQLGQLAEAKAEYRTALALWQQLSDEDPSALDFRSQLASIHANLGWQLLKPGRPSEAEAESRLALDLFHKLLKEDSRNAFRRYHANADNNLSVALRRLGRTAEALEHSDRSIEVGTAVAREEPKNSTYQAGLAENHLERGLARRALGDAAGAAADVRQAIALVEGLPRRSDEQWFLSACAQAALAGLAGQDRSDVSAAEGVDAAARAIGLLHKAFDMGYRWADAYRTEDALDPLRTRDDFQILMMDLALPAEPFSQEPDEHATGATP